MPDSYLRRLGVDGRVEPGHDEGGVRRAIGNGRTNSQRYKRGDFLSLPVERGGPRASFP
jgi:hypothetical protein